VAVGVSYTACGGIHGDRGKPLKPKENICKNMLGINFASG
jgi:hypothetical protein